MATHAQRGVGWQRLTMRTMVCGAVYKAPNLPYSLFSSFFLLFSLSNPISSAVSTETSIAIGFGRRP